MEEFIHKESAQLTKGLLTESKISWPSCCRNCEHLFSEKEKTDVCQTLLRNPELDFLKVVRDVLMGERVKVNYCCINNFRPSILSFGVSHEKEENFSGVDGIFVEEGLVEWYGLTWEDDEEWVDTEPLEDKSFSLFQIEN
jgi:hypothetical protein